MRGQQDPQVTMLAFVDLEARVPPDHPLRLEEGEAGRLKAAEGESIGTIRRRLGAAPKQSERNLTIRRTGDEIYFRAAETRRRRRGASRASG